MSNPTELETPPPWRPVHVQEYPEPVDLSGRNLVGMLDRSKMEVSALLGKLAVKSEMKTEELPGESVTSLTGEIADEVHEWPRATLGKNFRHLTLQFRDERLINLGWKFQGAIPDSKKRWWKFW